MAKILLTQSKQTKMKKYNHAYDIGFTVLSSNPNGEATNEEIIQGLERRLHLLKMNPDEVQDAVECYDPMEEEQSEEAIGEWYADCPLADRILIIVSGGMIQEVKANRNPEVIVIDHDIEGVDEERLIEGPDGDECFVFAQRCMAEFSVVDWWPEEVVRIVPQVPDTDQLEDEDKVNVVDAYTGRVVAGTFDSSTEAHNYCHECNYVIKD